MMDEYSSLQHRLVKIDLEIYQKIQFYSHCI